MERAAPTRCNDPVIRTEGVPRAPCVCFILTSALETHSITATSDVLRNVLFQICLYALHLEINSSCSTKE